MAQQIPVAVLQRFSPLSELDESARARLAESARLDKVQPGRKFDAADEQAWLVYLVSGSLHIVTRGSPEAVTGGSVRSLEPLFGNRVQNDFAVTETVCVLLRIDRAESDGLLAAVRTAGFEVEAVETSSDEMDIFQEIYDASISKRLQLPPMPEVAMRIGRMMENPDVGINDLTKVVQMDPAVTGALIYAANSPIYRGSSPIANVREAIIRLGFNSTRSLASSISLRQAFQIESQLVRDRMSLLWEHSVTVSAICFVLARRTRRFDPERALLAGVMHDIGVIPILRHIEQNRISLTPDALERTIAKLHAMVGVMVMNYWKMDKDLVTVAEESDDWLRTGNAQPDLCDLVIVAQLLEIMDSQKELPVPSLGETPAFKKLQLGDDVAICSAILQEAEHEVASIKQLLHG